MFSVTPLLQINQTELQVTKHTDLGVQQPGTNSISPTSLARE